MNVFIKNIHKLIPLLIETENMKYVKKLFTGGEKIPSASLLNKKVLCLAQELSITVSDSIGLCSKFNPEMLRKLHAVFFRLNLYEASHTNEERVFSIINDTNIVNFAEYCNYIMKAIFTNDNIDIRALGEQFTTWSCRSNFEDFLRLYRDYTHLIDVNADDVDLYPENLEQAHNAAMDRHELIQDEKIDEELMEKFSQATEEYKSLSYKSNEMEVIIPTRPLDLINESKKLHHCVKTYIGAVCDGKTRICLIRKNEEPYITVEINKDNEIVQAKKAFNKLPNDDDVLFLKEWSKEKKLTIRSY